MDFNLPKQAYVNKFIPKNKFFTKINVNSKLKQEFSDSINRITWTHKIAESTVNINKTDKVEEIEIFELELKIKLIPKNVLKVIDKTIPYPILYVFKYENHIAYGITLKEDSSQRYYFSEWDENKQFTFSGIDLERVYQGIITTFIGISQEGKNFDTIIETDKNIETLKEEISILKNKVKNEKQFNKKVELNKILLEKKKNLEAIL
jgi:hypothetical protein